MAPKDAVEMTAETTKSKDDKKGKKKGEDEIKEDTLSEEDQELKERLETCVSTLVNEAKEESVTVPLRLKALDVIVTELRTATSSMTSVPKPLKFLRPHFAILKELHTTLSGMDLASVDNDMLELRARLADVLAVLAMTLGKHGMQTRQCECASIVFRSWCSYCSCPLYVIVDQQRRGRVSSSSFPA